MSDGVRDKVIDELLRQAFEFFSGYQNRKTLSDVGRLHFWSDGMLQELRLIRDGKETPDTYDALRRKSRENAEGAEKAMSALRKARNALGGGPIARAIDECIAGKTYSKSVILLDISELVNSAGSRENHMATAARICAEIEALNAALDRLHRLLAD